MDRIEHSESEAPIVLGRASTATLGDMGMDEPEGGPPLNGLVDD